MDSPPGRPLPWFAAAARTCKTWLDPALRRLYHTVNLDARNEGFIPSVDIVARIGHRVRTLIVDDYGTPEDSGLNAAFHNFTNLTSLMVVVWTKRRVCAEDNPRLSVILSCPSLPNLVTLDIWSRHSSSLPTLLGITRNLRRLKITPR
jgi:hypothetical protein